MAYEFCFGDYWNTDLFIRVDGTPDIEIAQRDGKFVPIAGKSGDDYIDNGRYNNVEFSRDIAVVKKGGLSVREIVDNLINEYAYMEGYQDFEDSDHPNLITKAVLTNFSEVNKSMRALNRTTLRFNRIPFWYHVTGLQYTGVDLDAKIKYLTNPYKLTAKPIIEFDMTTGSSTSCTYSITDPDGTEHIYSINQATIRSKPIVIDCEKQTAKRGDDYVLFDIPEGFKEGESVFKLLTGADRITAIRIMPRWRCLR